MILNPAWISIHMPSKCGLNCFGTNDLLIQPAFYNECNDLSTQGLKLIPICKRSPICNAIVQHNWKMSLNKELISTSDKSYACLFFFIGTGYNEHGHNGINESIL